MRDRGTEHPGLGLEQPGRLRGGGQEERSPAARLGGAVGAAPECSCPRARAGTPDGFSGGDGEPAVGVSLEPREGLRAGDTWESWG